jgi:hypothetical protein
MLSYMLSYTLSYTPLMHSSHTCSHTLSHTLSSHTLLSYALSYTLSCTPLIHALILFGQIDIQHTEETLTVDGWIKFVAVARIGVLVKALRAELDALLKRKIEDPSWDCHSGGGVMGAIEMLLLSDGMKTPRGPRGAGLAITYL